MKHVQYITTELIHVLWASGKLVVYGKERKTERNPSSVHL